MSKFMKMSIQRLVSFSVLVVILLSAAQLRAADSELSGIFKGSDQPAQLAFVSAHTGSPIAGKETIKLIFTVLQKIRLLTLSALRKFPRVSS